MKTKRLGRRAKIALAILGLLLLAVAAFALTLVLTSPSPGLPAQPVVEKPIPEAWATEIPDPAGAAPSPYWTMTGSLSLLANGRAFGDEAYQLDVSPEGVRLSSTGRFWFRVVLANVSIAFRQEWAGTVGYEPVSFALHVEAPLGQGYDVAARLEGNELRVERGEETRTVSIDPSRALVLGMFSTYALIPAVFPEREEGGVAAFDALVFGGPPGAASGVGTELPTLVVERSDDATILLAGRALTLDRYRIRSSYGDSLLYAKGREFLALVAGTAERPLVAYRSDYFPEGFPLSPGAP